MLIKEQPYAVKWEVVIETEGNSEEEVSISMVDSKKEDGTESIAVFSLPSPPPSDLKLSEKNSPVDHDSINNSQVEDARGIFKAWGDIPQLSDNNGDGICINGKVIGNTAKEIGELSNNVSNNMIDATAKLCKRHRVKESSQVAAENVGNALLVDGSYTIDATEKAKKKSAFADCNNEQMAGVPSQG